MKMARKFISYILLSMVCIIFISCSKKIVPGKYRTNFPSYGMFGKRLTLNCDGSMVLRFSGDLMDDSSYGKWTTNKDTLFLVFDTINYPDSRYKAYQDLLIRGKRLKDKNMPFNKKQYKEFFDTIQVAGLDTLKVPSYRELKKAQGKTFANFTGKMKRQYFVRYEKFSCKK